MVPFTMRMRSWMPTAWSGTSSFHLPGDGTWEMKKRLDKGGWVVMGWHFVVFVGWDQVHEENRKRLSSKNFGGKQIPCFCKQMELAKRVQRLEKGTRYSLFISEMEREGSILLDPQWNYPSHCESTHTKKTTWKNAILKQETSSPTLVSPEHADAASSLSYTLCVFLSFSQLFDRTIHWTLGPWPK